MQHHDTKDIMADKSDVPVQTGVSLAPYLQAVAGAVKANPIAAVLVGVGVAWLIWGRKADRATAEAPLAGTRFEALSRWEDEGGPVAPLPDLPNA
jgi:hypothetical protein